MTVWLTSDQHFGHRLVSGLRGFGEDTAAHDQALCDNWADTVRAGDQVWVLGDLAMGRPDAALAMLGKLPGVKHLIPGNHDTCHPMHRESFKHQRAYMDVFESVQMAARRKVNGQVVLLSHLPYTTDRGFEARYPQWRLPDLGEWLFHGHTHSKEQVTSGHELHVGVDAWDLKPVSLETLAKLMRGETW